MLIVLVESEEMLSSSQRFSLLGHEQCHTRAWKVWLEKEFPADKNIFLKNIPSQQDGIFMALKPDLSLGARFLQPTKIWFYLWKGVSILTLMLHDFLFGNCVQFLILEDKNSIACKKPFVKKGLKSFLKNSFDLHISPPLHFIKNINLVFTTK